jgi:hypothetical protein
MDWGIKRWPTITLWKKPQSFAPLYRSWKKAEGVEAGQSMLQPESQLVREAAGEHHPRLMLQDPKKSSILGGSSLAASDVGTSRTSAAPNPALTDLGIQTATKPTVPVLPEASTTIDGQVSTPTPTQIAIRYEDMLAFATRVSRSQDSLVGLEVLRSELRYIMMRERSEAEAIIAKANDRRAIWDRVLDRVDDTIVSMREGSSDERTEIVTRCEGERGAADHSATGVMKEQSDDSMGEDVQ